MAPDARSLHCPNCGAAVGSEAPRCPYCRARLAAVSCPSCFSLMFAGAVYCEKCGAKSAREEREASASACPGCSRTLQRVAVGANTLLECGGCDGVWLDAADFERICADKEAQAAVQHQLAGRRPAAAAAEVRYRPCLRCGKMMNRINFGRVSGAIVDVCKGHGTFLDAGELHQIVAFIQAGGLDRTRARENDELRDEQRRRQDAQFRHVRDRDSRHRGPSGRDGEIDPGMLAEIISLIVDP
jgi:Zn-finger nucleic acid-binding protein